MTNRVVGTPEFEAKQLFDLNNDEDLFEYFFEDASPPYGVSKDDYLKELRKEFYKLKKEEAKRLLGLKQEIIYYQYEFPDGQIFNWLITNGTLRQRDRDLREMRISPLYNLLKKFPDTKPKKNNDESYFKTNKNAIYL